MAEAPGAGLPIDGDALRAKYLAERDKRLRPNPVSLYTDASGTFAHFADDPYVEPGFTRDAIAEEVDVAVIGGGFGGLLTGAKLNDRSISSFRIIEQGGDFGGTWYWNRYPGVRCDIESYCYMPLLEETGTIPSEKYATGAEIFAHCQTIGRHFGLYDKALFQTKVEKLVWDEATLRWIITTNRGDRIAARFVTVSQGPLAKVKLPAIPGIRHFAGKMFHSSRWDYDYTGGDASGGQTGLADKRVGIIGTGATAVQIIPRLAENAQEVLVFQRTPSAIDARNNQPTDPAWFAAQPPGWQRARMKNFLSILSVIPQSENLVGDSWTDFWVRFGGLMAERHRTGDTTPPPVLMQRVDHAKMDEIRARTAALVSDPVKAEALKPWYNYLCKRPLFSDDYLQAFDKPNVTLIDTQGRGVESITPTGMVFDGKEYPVDCIIFATGFDVGAAAHKVGGYDVIGRGGRSIGDKWTGGFRSLHGTQFSGFPNFHIVGGAEQGTTAFNFTHILDMQAEHATEIIAACIDKGHAAIEVTADAEARWHDVIVEKHVDHQQFYEDCTPGFLNNEGDFKDRPTFIGGTYGGSPFEYEQIVMRWRNEEMMQDVTVTTMK
jgi:cyclohexanone monooxygenase